MSDDRKYVRVYYEIISDPKFRGVYSNERTLGTWLKLLMAADALWPAPSALPRYASSAVIKILADCRLIELVDEDHYRVKGLDTERSRRKKAATVGGRASGVARNDRATNAEQTLTDRSQTPENKDEPSQAEPSQAEQSKAQSEQGERANDPADIYYRLTAKYPTPTVLSWIDKATEQYGPEAVIRGIVTAHVKDSSPATLMGRAQDLWRMEARQLDLQERAAERERVREKRALPPVLEPWEEAYRAELHRQYAEDAA